MNVSSKFYGYSAITLAGLLLICSCGKSNNPPPAVIPPINKSVKLQPNGALRLDIKSRMHKDCTTLVDYDTQIRKAFSGEINSAETLYKRDDDGAGNDDDISVSLDLYVYKPENSAGRVVFPATYDDAKWNNITLDADVSTLMNDANINEWMLIVTSLPPPCRCLGPLQTRKNTSDPQHINWRCDSA